MEADNASTAAAIRGRGWRNRVREDCSRDRCGPTDASINTFTDDIVCGRRADIRTVRASDIHAIRQPGIAEPDQRIAVRSAARAQGDDAASAPAAVGRLRS